MNSAVSEGVSRSVIMEAGTGDPVGACDSKTARKNTLFPCLVGLLGYRMGDELAVVGNVGGCKKTSLGVGELV
jgi:hypothetical protein